MIKGLYRHPTIAWNWWAFVMGKFEKHYFFRIDLVPNNVFLPWWQRYFCQINLIFFHYLKQNKNFQIGLNFGKQYLGLYRHY